MKEPWLKARCRLKSYGVSWVRVEVQNFVYEQSKIVNKPYFCICKL